LHFLILAPCESSYSVAIYDLAFWMIPQLSLAFVPWFNNLALGELGALTLFGDVLDDVGELGVLTFDGYSSFFFFTPWLGYTFTTSFSSKLSPSSTFCYHFL